MVAECTIVMNLISEINAADIIGARAKRVDESGMR